MDSFQKGDLVSGADRYGNGVMGEVIAATDRVVHIQPSRQKLANGTWFQGAAVAIDASACAVVEKAADREETDAQRDERIARARFAARTARRPNRGRER